MWWRNGDTTCDDGEDQADASGLHCHLRPWWYLDPYCQRGLCLGTTSFHSMVLLMVMAHITTKGREDVYGLGCCLNTCSYQWIVLLSLGAILMGVACAATWSHSDILAHDTTEVPFWFMVWLQLVSMAYITTQNYADVHGLGYCLKPRWCLWFQLPLRAVSGP